MPSIEYRMFFNNSPATQAQLDLVESIEVEQDVDLAWEARLEVPLCTSDKGKWQQEDQKILDDFGRVRVEVKIGKDAFVPLIDGSIVGFDNRLSGEPGRSSVTVHVQDDSVLLNRDESVEFFGDKTDDQIARRLFQSIPEIADVQADPVPPLDGGLAVKRVRRSTPIVYLRQLAKLRNMHAYVLPGGEPGKSVGVFKKFPTAKDGLPDMIFAGPDRNIGNFNVRNLGTQPGSATSYSVSLTDAKVVKKTSDPNQTDRTGAKPGLPPAKAGKYLLRPDEASGADLDSAVQARSDKSSYQFEVSGELYTECYGKPLAPYRLVTVKGVNGKLSGDYIVKGVKHALDRNTYKQTFELTRNALSTGASAPPAPLGKIL